MNVEQWTINGYCLEYLDDSHTYLVDGIIVPSITQILKLKFGDKYNNVSKIVLNRASEKGNAVHKAIEDYEQQGKECELKELRNYKFLKEQYKFECLNNEVPVILFDGEKPICAGRLDLILDINNELGLGDIKRTSVLDLEYLAYQLTLYAIAFEQCYENEVKFLRAVHLRDDVRKFKEVKRIDKEALELVNQYLREEENE